MLLDCAIIGGGPAGLNAALVLGRAKRNVMVFDDNRPMNAATHESHGFLTRDGIDPREFRNIAHQELSKYPSVAMRNARIVTTSRDTSNFELTTETGDLFHARTILLATGLKLILPAIEGIEGYFGTSLFTCPYCDGWEMRDKPLVVISDGVSPFHLATVAWNWSRDLLVCTNGHPVLSSEEKERLQRNEIRVIEDKIAALEGANGGLERIVFATGEESRREGGFVVGQILQASSLGAALGCELNAQGGILVDNFGRTTVSGVYAAGDTTGSMFSQLIIAASGGSRVAGIINMDLIQKELR